MSQVTSNSALSDELIAAQRLARTIASDVMLYHREKVIEGLQCDDLFERLEEELKEARELYEERVSAALRAQHNLLERALVDVLIASHAHIPCELW